LLGLIHIISANKPVVDLVLVYESRDFIDIHLTGASTVTNDWETISGILSSMRRGICNMENVSQAWNNSVISPAHVLS